MPFIKHRSKDLPPRKMWEKLSKRTGLRHAIFSPSQPDKDVYIGEWDNDVKAGKGAMLARTNYLYEGDWNGDRRHGFGTLAFKLPDKTFKLLYRGEWVNGYRHGYGEQHYPDDGYYAGYWAYNKRSGYGRMWYSDGSFYDGDWKNDMRDGLGLFVRVDGNRYEGAWMKDMKHGKGRFYHLDSGQLQEGVWREDYPICTSVVDIRFRQVCQDPTPYPVQPVELEFMQAVQNVRETGLLKGKPDSCLFVIEQGA